MGRKMFTRRTLPMALAAVLAISPMQVMAAGNDLNGHWAEKVITEWQDKGLIKGYENGTFKPGNNITRAEFVTIMNNALGYEDAAALNFTDVAAGNWYYELTNTVATQKYFNYEKACMTLIGESGTALYSPVRSASSAGVKTAIDSVSNKVDQAVAKANELIQQKLAADRAKYN